MLYSIFDQSKPPHKPKYAQHPKERGMKNKKKEKRQHLHLNTNQKIKALRLFLSDIKMREPIQ